MRLIAIAVCLLSATQAFSQDQSPPKAGSKDPVAVLLTERVGPPLDSQSIVELQGTLKLSLGAQGSFPISIRLMGPDHYRSELTMPAGKVVRIVNRGRAVQIAADGKVRFLSASNTFAATSVIMPGQLLATHRSSNKFDLLQGSLSTTGIVMTNLSGADSVRNPIIRMSRKTFFLSPVDGQVSSVEYERFAENSGGKQRVRVEYGDYRTMGSLNVPTRQVTYVDGRQYAELTITYVQRLPADPTAFAVPEVKSDR